MLKIKYLLNLNSVKEFNEYWLYMHFVSGTVQGLFFTDPRWESGWEMNPDVLRLVLKAVPVTILSLL